MNLHDLFTEEKVRLDPKCWTGKKIGNPKTKVKGGVRVNNCVPAESVEEGTRAPNEIGGANSMRQKLGDIIKQAVQDDEGAYNASKLYRKLWDIYGGDIDAIIAERSIFELQKLARELVPGGKQGVAEAELDEKSVSQAQFRTMAAAAHNPKFAKKVGISQDVAKEFHSADKHSNYKKLPDRTTEGEQQPGADYRDPKEVDYDDEYDAMVSRVKKLAGLGPMKTVYDPTKRQYRNMPTAVQPPKK